MNYVSRIASSTRSMISLESSTPFAANWSMISSRIAMIMANAFGDMGALLLTRVSFLSFSAVKSFSACDLAGVFGRPPFSFLTGVYGNERPARIDDRVQLPGSGNGLAGVCHPCCGVSARALNPASI